MFMILMENMLAIFYFYSNNVPYRLSNGEYSDTDVKFLTIANT